MAHTCRGTINLANALIHTEDSTTIVISNGGAQTFHLKATSEVERQKWVTALELAKSEAIKMLEAGEETREIEFRQKNALYINIYIIFAPSLQATKQCFSAQQNHILILMTITLYARDTLINTNGLQEAQIIMSPSRGQGS